MLLAATKPIRELVWLPVQPLAAVSVMICQNVITITKIAVRVIIQYITDRYWKAIKSPINIGGGIIKPLPSNTPAEPFLW